jgi:hypothetical protein
LTEASAYSVLKNGYFDATLLSDDVLAGYYEPYENKETRETLVRCMLHFDDTFRARQAESHQKTDSCFSRA